MLCKYPNYSQLQDLDEIQDSIMLQTKTKFKMAAAAILNLFPVAIEERILSLFEI